MNTIKPLYHGFRFPPEIISHAVWLYHRFTLSLRDVEDRLAEREIVVTYETIRQWCRRFGPDYAHRIRKHQGRAGDIWHLDEMHLVTINGQRRYLWRAVDQDGDVIDILVQKRKDKQAAMRLFKRLLKGEGFVPNRIVTDNLPSYAAAKRALIPDVRHCQDRYANNRAEVRFVGPKPAYFRIGGWAPNRRKKGNYLWFEN
jgi:putative transposase